MEVGAVKQAFNNEVINLKKNLNQAKIQIIHKLTRKAKTLVEKKAPEHLKEKIERKAKLAVSEVLLLKKVTTKDLAKFAVTHTGSLNEYLNKPAVDSNKACARLLLHKALQAKYKLIRNTYSNIPINDLLMSRLERRKLKKEQQESKKKKQEKNKNKSVSSEGNWEVEDVIPKAVDLKSNDISDDDKESDDDEMDQGSDVDQSDLSDNDEGEEKIGDNEVSDIENDEGMADNAESDEDNDEEMADKAESDDDIEAEVGDQQSDDESEVEQLEKDSDEDNNSPDMESDKPIEKNADLSSSVDKRKPQKQAKKPPKEDNRKKIPKKVSKETNKNKNFAEKLQSKKLKKDLGTPEMTETKIVDPFFMTASGDKYMSLAEPRAPDEVKEVHKQGNRQMRRAAMFGHAPKTRPRNNFNNQNTKFRQNQNGRFDKQNGGNGGLEKRGGFEKHTGRVENRNGAYEKRGGGFEKQNSFRGKDVGFDKGNRNWTRNEGDKNGKPQFDSAKKGPRIEKKAVPEKLHPSWEAKKKQSGILPFQGKKITFD